MTTTQNVEFQGYHKFRAEDGSEYGSFEVFYEDGSDPLVKSGWYWWPCHPGYLPDGDSNGPFPTAESAMLDALEGSREWYDDSPMPDPVDPEAPRHMMPTIDDLMRR